jgi:hypothetical protein
MAVENTGEHKAEIHGGIYPVSTEEVQATARMVLEEPDDYSRLSDIFVRRAANGEVQAEWMSARKFSAAAVGNVFDGSIYVVQSYSTETKTLEPNSTWAGSTQHDKRKDAISLIRAFEEAKRADPQWTKLKAAGQEKLELDMRSYNRLKAFIPGIIWQLQ